MRQWKNFENQLKFGKERHNKEMGRFGGPSVDLGDRSPWLRQLLGLPKHCISQQITNLDNFCESS